MSAGFDNVSTVVTCNFPLATNSCTKNCRNSICFVFRVTPLHAMIDFADEESVYTVKFVLQCLINSSIVDVTLKASIVVMLIAYNSASQDRMIGLSSACASSRVMTSTPISLAIDFNRQQFRFALRDSSSCFPLNSEFQIGCCSIVSNNMFFCHHVCICRRCKCLCSFFRSERRVRSRWYDQLKHSHCSFVSRIISWIQRVRDVGLR